MGISSSLGSSALLPAGLGFRNKIINGDMRINQRLSPAATSGYPVDRWFLGWSAGSVPSIVQSTTVFPAGFSSSIALSITTGAAINSGVGNIQQRVEGYNAVDIGFGTASPQTMVLSFWVRASIAGIYCVALRNNAADRSYVAEYTINTINTWEYKNITIIADSTGTWEKTTSAAFALIFSVAASTANTTASVWTAGNFIVSPNQTHLAGTTGATFNFTGVQLEKNYQATPFEQRPIGVELALCQRYFEKSYDLGTAPATVTETGVHRHSGSGNASGRHYVPIRFKVEKRANDYTVTTYDPTTAGSSWVTQNPSQAGLGRTPLVENKGTSGMVLNVEDGGYSWTVGNTRGHWSASSEL